MGIIINKRNSLIFLVVFVFLQDFCFAQLVKGESRFELSTNITSASKALTRFQSEIREVDNRFELKKREYENTLEANFNDFSEKANTLHLIESKVGQQGKELENNFDIVEKIWLEVSSKNLAGLLQTKVSYPFQRGPSLPASLVDKEKDLAVEWLSKLDQDKRQSEESLQVRKQAEIRQLNELVLKTNTIRGNLYKGLPGHYKLGRVFSLKGLWAIKNEVLTSPYRLLAFFYSKYYFVRDKLLEKSAGLLELAQITLRVILFLFSLIFLNFIYKKVIEKIDIYQRVLSRKHLHRPLVQSAVTSWSKIKENMINLLWLITLNYMRGWDSLEDYVLLIDLTKVIFAVRILKSLVILFLGFVSFVDYRNFASFKKKAMMTASVFGNIFLAYNILLVLIQAAVGEVFLYSICKVIIVIYTIWLVIRACAAWEEEFKKYIESRFAGVIVQRLNLILGYLPRYIRIIFTFLAIVVLSVFDFLIKITENFEISKKVSANLFKKQIESVEATEDSEKEISKNYKERFAFQSLKEESQEYYVDFDDKLEQRVFCEINEWRDDKSDEHSLVLYGDKGVGKTTFLKHIKGKLEGEDAELDVIYCKMPAKTLKKEELQKFLLKAILKTETLEQTNMGQLDQLVQKKTVIIIDESQNLFLSQIGGFESYYFLTELMNSVTENIFWVMAFNKYSWLYLDRAFGRTQFFRNVLELKGWSDTHIKDLIMKRHESSGHRLSYDLLINATRSQDEIDKYASVEAKFFKLLWELSRGNPRAALSLWLSALSRKNAKIFNVNIPREPDLAEIDKCSDDLLFVLAHVLKHENLALHELESSTKLPRGIVRNAIKVSLERSYLHRDSRHRFMIDINLQHSLVRYLRVKNFVYGN